MQTLDAMVSQVIATMANSHNRVTVWNEDHCWRYMRECFPNAHDEFLQQIADRVQWQLTR